MRYETQTYLTPQEVTQAAISFFGVEVGLELESQGFDTLHFVGGGGHVTLTIQEGTPVVAGFDTREWDAQVEEFMGYLARKRWWRRLWKTLTEELS